MTRDVPCNGCTLCCKTDAVRLLPGDSTDYWVEPHPYMAGQWMLAHKESGDCIYLNEHGCSIHERRPKMCREMDCRLVAQTFSKKKAEKLNMPMAVWNRGQELLSPKIITKSP